MVHFFDLIACKIMGGLIGLKEYVSMERFLEDNLPPHGGGGGRVSVELR